MKLGSVIPYLKRIQKKYINHVTHPLGSAGIEFFHLKSATFVISRNTDIDYIFNTSFLILLTFL